MKHGCKYTSRFKTMEVRGMAKPFLPEARENTNTKLKSANHVYIDMSVSITMLKGLLKMSMLKIISENKTTGYGIIKKVNELTGEKPSTGSVYPLLRSMMNKGLITGKTVDGKTFYEITDSGKKIVQAHGSMKDYYAQKISRSLSLAHDTFSDLHLALIDDSTLVNPVVSEVSSLLAHGVAPEQINSVLSKTLITLQKLY